MENAFMLVTSMGLAIRVLTIVLMVLGVIFMVLGIIYLMKLISKKS